jgi:hypothetical protein
MGVSRPRVVLAVLLALGCLAVGACGGGDEESGFADCGKTLFSEQQDDGVFNIRAKGVGCDVALQIAGGARTVDLAGTSLDFQAVGYDCKGSLAQHDGRPGVDYACGSDANEVRFTRY